ncbi:hypothetical protein CVD19_07590 [Bacillus sp. T33-2]|nr:hypothetical protein CVD19_07590 [Bacillus sp. T33-2]
MHLRKNKGILAEASYILAKIHQNFAQTLYNLAKKKNLAKTKIRPGFSHPATQKRKQQSAASLLTLF